jgi:tetratricopeptide (TPR) repeat protein
MAADCRQSIHCEAVEQGMSETISSNRILLGQLISNGDCLYATAIAQQIKRDFPGCHLTWAVSALCRRTIEENPWIDSVWVIPLAGWSDECLRASWNSFVSEALERYEQGLYDFVFFTQIYPGNPHHFEGTVRPSILLGYPGRITVPLEPSLVLRTEEVERVKHFAQQNLLTDFEQVILFECSPKSGQSHITPEFAHRAAVAIITESAGRHAVILCSQQTVQRPLEGIIDGSILTLREMAELTKYCTLVIGCSSGISCISTSTWAKPLPMIQMLSSQCAMFASLAYDYLYFGLPTAHVIEMFDADVERLVSCFRFFLEHGWEKTRAIYHEDPQVSFGYYLGFAKTNLFSVYDYFGFCVSLRHVVDRYGWHTDLEAALREVARKILGRPVGDREMSPDHLLLQVGRRVRALTAAASGIWGYDPPSLRPETCVLPLRRSRSELEEIIKTTCGLSRDNPEFSQLIAALTDRLPKDRIALHQAANPEKPWSPVAWILALMQQAEYAKARQELLAWKQISPSWNSQLEEILGDLNWMQGYHSQALASYRNALQCRPNHLQLLRKADRLSVRNDAPLAVKKLGDLGFVLCGVQPIDNVPIKVLIQSQLKIAGSFNLEIAFVTTPWNGQKDWPLVGGEDLQKITYDLPFGCKKLIQAAVDWADRKGKKWIAVAGPGSIITIPVLRELQNRLAHDPSALIAGRWDIAVSPNGTVLKIREKPPLTPALILMRIDWWRKNSWQFPGYGLRAVDWMAFYAIKILRLTEAAYLCDAEQRLPTLLQPESLS